ncbi:MAG: CRTAC1 family protein [Blastocatellia bacterium]|jgi:enediyne biosynthesis protein E4
MRRVVLIATIVVAIYLARPGRPPAIGGEGMLFTDVSAPSGLDFYHRTGATGEYYLPEIMGSGVALLDYDRDGDLDVYLLQGRRLSAGNGAMSERTESRPRSPKEGPSGNRLFRNELVPSGRLRFSDVTDVSRTGRDEYAMGVATGDYDNDGDVDLYLTSFGSNALLRNNGDGTFSDVTAAAGVDDPRWSTSAAFLDYDRDGDLDLYVCNYVDFTVTGNKQCLAPTGERDYCAPAAYRPVPDRLFRNNGNGRFSDVSSAAGISAVSGPALGVATADFNGDGWTDIYVANDGAANHLWLNRRDGTFEESGLLSGAAYAADGMARAGMGLAVADIDRDSDFDILVTNLTRQGSTLYRNNGKGLFDDATIDFRLAQPTYLSTGFGVAWIDFDLDGWLDLFAANGAVTRLPALRGEPYPYHQRNQLFRHETDRQSHLREVGPEAGPALALSEVSRGLAVGDLDNDGAPDLLVTNNNGPARLLRNQGGRGRHWLQVELTGAQPLGALVVILVSGSDRRWYRVHTDGSYLSAGDPRLLVGLGAIDRVEGVGVIWPNGVREWWPGPAVDRLHRLKSGTGQPWNLSF